MRRELLGDALLGRDGGLGGLLVLRAVRRGGGDLIPLVYLMEAEAQVLDRLVLNHT